jgi:DNA repair exonuclease SbcCD ATPase subunit
VIILQKLSWDNCFSYGAGNEIDLANANLTQLVGTNGVGKSSVPLILEEVLFNKNSKNVKKADIANRYVNQGYDISLDFSVDQDSYNITVSRRATLKCKLTKNGEDISSHTASNTYKTVLETLGIDFKTFTQLVYQNTNTSLQFLTATDTNRKKFLIDLLKLDDYVAFFETFKEAVRLTTQDVIKLNAKTDTIVKWLTDNKLESMTLLEKVNLPKISEKDEQELRSLQVRLENIHEKNRKINDNNNLLERLKSIDIDQCRKDLEKCETVKPTSKLVSKIGAMESRREQELAMSEKYETLRNKRRSYDLKTKKVEPMSCPTCEQEIDMEFVNDQWDKHELQVAGYTIAIKDVQGELEEIENENQIHREAARRTREWETLYRSVDTSVSTTIFDKAQVESQIRELEDKVKEARESLNEIIDENTRRERHNTRISIIGEQTSDFESELDGITNSLGRIEDKLSILEILKKAFSTNGLLAYKIESLVKELEDLTNEYLAEFSDGRFSINFVVENDKLNVEVTDNAKIIDILALSSGELARVNIATLVAIRKLMTSISRSQINVLFLDEVNQALDEAGKEKVVEILLKEETLNTFLVSHGWTHPLLEKVEIIKEDNISRLE